MKFFFAAALFLASGFLLAQTTKKVSFKNEDPEFKEVYYVLEGQPEIKHGKYKKSSSGYASLTEEGQYENNIKTGIWEYHSNAGLEQQIDFSNNTVLFSKPFKSLVGSLIVDGKNLKENNSGKVPILLGGQAKLSRLFVKYMRYPADARRNGVQGSVIVSATVTKEGLMIDEMIEQGPGYGLNEEALRLIQLIPDDWLPLIINDEALSTRVFIEVKFQLG